MSMDIFNTKSGDFVEFANPDAGHDWQQKDIQKRLSLNQKYEVDYLDIHSFSTDLYLVGFDLSFNSSFFENVNDYTGFKLKEK